MAGRYSDPGGRFRVLYGATERKAAFLETLQTYRPALTELVQLQQSSRSADIEFPRDTVGRVPVAYFEGKRIAAFRLVGSLPSLDLRAVDTHAFLRIRLASELLAAGYSGAFNFGEIIGSDYVATQQIAQWAFDAGYGAIVYPSAHHHTLSCWAVFDRMEIQPIGDSEVIRSDDPDLVAAAELFGLILPEDL